jgi:hypothetical protein
MEQDKKQIVVRKMPTALWQQLKIQAAIEGSTLQATIEKAIEQYLKSA